MFIRPRSKLGWLYLIFCFLISLCAGVFLGVTRASKSETQQGDYWYHQQQAKQVTYQVYDTVLKLVQSEFAKTKSFQSMVNTVHFGWQNSNPYSILFLYHYETMDPQRVKEDVIRVVLIGCSGSAQQGMDMLVKIAKDKANPEMIAWKTHW